MMHKSLAAISCLAALCSTQQLASDPLTAGPPLELVHLYYDQWPTGVAVSSTGRMFSNYPGGFDSNNTNNGMNNKYTLAELVGNSSQRAYPNVEFNSPPGGAINYSTYPATGANYQNHLIGVQNMVIDPLDRLWILDTGRVLTPNGTLVPSSYGGPKLIGVNLANDTIFRTIVFPPNVVFSDSYLNDIRFDLRPNITVSGQGIGYMTDSSTEGRNGIVMVDLGTGESWRHLNGAAVARAERQFSANVWGDQLYFIPGPNEPLSYIPVGSDGIALSADGETLYFSPVASRHLYSLPTKRLRARGQFSELQALQTVVDHGEKGLSDGLQQDSNGLIYVGNEELNAISIFHAGNGTFETFVRDPRMGWIDTSKF